MAWLSIVALAAASPQSAAAIPEYRAVVVKTYPHDQQSFTEGLFYTNGYLYESTGRKGDSSIRKIVLETGQIVQRHDIDAQYFGEGIVGWKDKLIELTWQAQTGFVYNLGTFAQTSDFHYPGEGWALTHDGTHLIMSDGTSDLRLLDPNTLKEISRISVNCDGRPVHRINELEWIKGEIYANVWLTNLIIRINPSTGDVVGFVNLTDLVAMVHANDPESVPNGIAYDAGTDRLFVTGKLWPSLYQITLQRQPDTEDLCLKLP